MMGTLSPAAVNYEENVSTLNFASTVKNIKLESKAAVVNKKDLVPSFDLNPSIDGKAMFPHLVRCFPVAF